MPVSQASKKALAERRESSNTNLPAALAITRDPLIIWAGNLPEEIPFYLKRSGREGWWWVSAALIVFRAIQGLGGGALFTTAFATTIAGIAGFASGPMA